MIAIIKYNAGNIKSVKNAIDRLGYESVITDDFETISRAEKVIFPGVGEAKSAMQYLQEKELDELILSLKQPILGICLGLQLMCDHSEERDTKCLGIFNAKVKRFPKNAIVPHMGWNEVKQIRNHPLWHNINNNSRFYSVHSYFVKEMDSSFVTGTTNYGEKFTSAIAKDKLFAVQFHPEKSQSDGLQLLKNFTNWV